MRFQHQKSGNHYQVLAIALKEDDLTPSVVYSCETTGQVWVRPAAEFFDGRFAAAPAKPNAELTVEDLIPASVSGPGRVN